MSSLAFSQAPTLFAEGAESTWTEEEIKEEREKAEAYALGLSALSEEADEVNAAEVARSSVEASIEAELTDYVADEPEAYTNEAHSDYASSYSMNSMSAFPGVLWADSFPINFGEVRTICISAWVIFLLLPLLFFTMVAAVYFHLASSGLQGFPLGHVENYSYNFEEPALYALIFLLFASTGSGPLAVDAAIAQSFDDENIEVP